MKNVSYKVLYLDWIIVSCRVLIFDGELLHCESKQISLIYQL